MPVPSPNRSSRGLAALIAGALALAACGGGEEAILVPVEATPTPEPTPIVEPTPTEAPAETPTPVETPTPAPTPTPTLPVWQVVDTVDRLNLRETPSTSAPVVHEFSPGDSGLVGTGEEASADGFDWIEISPDGDRPGGWVAIDFVIPDESAAPAVERACFHTEDGATITTVILDFSGDTFTGGVRSVISTDIEYRAVAGTRTDGGSVFTVTVAVVDGAERVEEWVSGASGIVLADDTAVDAANCADIAGPIESIEAEVTSYPAPPS